MWWFRLVTLLRRDLHASLDERRGTYLVQQDVTHSCGDFMDNTIYFHDQFISKHDTQMVYPNFYCNIIQSRYHMYNYVCQRI